VGDPDDHELITDAGSLDAFIEHAVAAPAYALDTELHRERTYYPALALIQIAGGERLVLIDPLAVDVTPLAALLDNDATAIIHAARQDLEVLEHSVGLAPRRVFDTQLAAGFLGLATPSLTSLLERELKVRLPKADRLTDWLKRPLTASQLRYAASDVAYLLELAERQAAEIESTGRREWFDVAMADLLAEPRGARNPTDAWRRIKEVRHLRGTDLAVAQAIAAWRERRAQELDLTPRFVLSDLGVVGLAVAKPASIEQIRDIRGVDARSLRHVRDDLLAAIAEGREQAPVRDTASSANEVPPSLKAAVPLIGAWAAHRARELRIDPALLATRSDLEAMLSGDADARLRRGWRYELLGSQIEQLLAGDMSLAFDARVGLLLERRGR